MSRLKKFFRNDFVQGFLVWSAFLSTAYNAGRYKVEGTFFGYKTRRWYVLDHYFRTTERLEYDQLPENDRIDGCQCEIRKGSYADLDWE
jgi:hypothetical protein